MKTILIVIAGMADLPDPFTAQDTPLSVAKTPALDMLARRGEILAVPPLSDFNEEISHKNALLSLLGYDLGRGIPKMEELLEFGLNNSAAINDFPSLRPFVIPAFSGHGVCLTTSAWVRGVAKCALIRPLDIYSPGSSDAEIADAIAQLVGNAVVNNEFVFIYIDSPLRASLRGDYKAKIRALEVLDRHLISPVADFVWKSELLINLAVTTDLITPWHRRQPASLRVPVALYFNNQDHEGDPDQRFTEVESMLNDSDMMDPSDLIRYLSNFNVEEEGD
ncbi:MAG: hypothetical protein J1F12_03560 [Muribaculaceae bacterium]|nr:hypothetical protein [Muribaculaceae bacterium]